MSAAVRQILDDLLSGQERPPMKVLLAELNAACAEAGEEAPSRATVYNYLARASVHAYVASELPPEVRACLYNMDDEVEVPGPQLVLRGLNEGNLAAVCFVAGMPWLDLYQARSRRGLRPRSRGLLEAACRVRKI